MVKHSAARIVPLSRRFGRGPQSHQLAPHATAPRNPQTSSRPDCPQCGLAVQGRREGVRFYHAAGWDSDALEHYKTRFGGFGKMVCALPDSYRRIADGDEFLIGERLWRVAVGRGHSPEHVCLYCPELQILI
jgi:hypothetical protein